MLALLAGALSALAVLGSNIGTLGGTAQTTSQGAFQQLVTVSDCSKSYEIRAAASGLATNPKVVLEPYCPRR